MVLLQAGAQRFEWVKTFLSDDDATARIIGTEVDSAGNLYFLSSFMGSSTSANWDGEPFLPTMPTGNNYNNGASTLLAKISPSGEMLWKKTIYTLYTNNIPCGMRMLGDTAIA